MARRSAGGATGGGVRTAAGAGGRARMWVCKGKGGGCKRPVTAGTAEPASVWVGGVRQGPRLQAFGPAGCYQLLQWSSRLGSRGQRPAQAQGWAALCRLFSCRGAGLRVLCHALLAVVNMRRAKAKPFGCAMAWPVQAAPWMGGHFGFGLVGFVQQRVITNVDVRSLAPYQ